MTRWTRRQALGHLGRLALGTAAGWGVVSRPAAGAGALRKVGIILGGPQINEGFVTIAVAQYLGFYRDEGIEVELIPSGGSNQAVQEVAAGKVLVGVPSPDPVILGYQPEAGLRLLWIYTAYQGFIYDIRTPAGSPLRSLAELGGKTIGVVNLASAAVPAAKAMLHENGVDPRSVSFVGIGVGSQGRRGAGGARGRGRPVGHDLRGSGKRGDQVQPALRLADAQEAVQQRPGGPPHDLPGRAGAARGPVPGDGHGDRVDLRQSRAGGAHLLARLPGEQAGRLQRGRGPLALPPRAPGAARQHDPRLGPGPAVGVERPPRWTAYEKFLYDQGIEKTRVDVTRIFPNALIPEINRFDAAALTEQAKTYVVGREPAPRRAPAGGLPACARDPKGALSRRRHGG